MRWPPPKSSSQSSAVSPAPKASTNSQNPTSRRTDVGGCRLAPRGSQKNGGMCRPIAYFRMTCFLIPRGQPTPADASVVGRAGAEDGCGEVSPHGTASGQRPQPATSRRHTIRPRHSRHARALSRLRGKAADRTASGRRLGSPHPSRPRQQRSGIRMTIRILIADDEALLRMAFSTVLDAQPDMAPVGEAADGREAIHLARELRPDVVLMDVRMPQTDGIEATRQVIRGLPAEQGTDPDHLRPGRIRSRRTQRRSLGLPAGYRP